jgi:hypothetical protein
MVLQVRFFVWVTAWHSLAYKSQRKATQEGWKHREGKRPKKPEGLLSFFPELL